MIEIDEKKACDAPLFDANLKPHVGIVLLNWNSKCDTLECLEALFRLEYENYTVVLCDNDSSDGTIEAVKDWAAGREAVEPASAFFKLHMLCDRRRSQFSWIELSRDEIETARQVRCDVDIVIIHTGANLGFAGGNNVGIRFALDNFVTDYVWLLNTDTFAHRMALNHLVDRALADRAIGMVGSTLIYYWKPEIVQALGGGVLDYRSTKIFHYGDGLQTNALPIYPEEAERALTYILGASLLVSRSFLETVGLMTEDYFLYYEEIDWTMRAADRFKIGYAPASVVYHKAGGASRRVASLASERFMWRNRIKFFARFLPNRRWANLRYMAAHALRCLAKGNITHAAVVIDALLHTGELSRAGRVSGVSSQP